MKQILSLLFSMVACLACAYGQVDTCWTSQGVVPGEKTILYVLVHNETEASVDPLPQIKGVSLSNRNRGYIPTSGARNNIVIYYEYEVVADAPGIVTIPSFTVRGSSNNVYHTPEQYLTVYPFSAVKWHSLPVEGGEFRYGTLWHVPNKTPYLNEPGYAEIKIYAPEVITNYRPPELEKNGISAPPFDATMKMSTGGIVPMGSALIQGRDWKVMAFQSNITPTRAGEVSLSGRVIGIASDRRVDSALALFDYREVPVPLNIPKLTMQVKELPPGAPEGFSNAVGDFTLKTHSEALDLSINDPVLVDVVIEGAGNINSLECPGIENPALWKLYPATKQGAPVRDSSGRETVRFQQNMRPLQEVDSIPPFKLSFFNPRTEQYHTVSSAPIPLPWKHSAAIAPGETRTPPPAGIVPVENMVDIYGLVPLDVIASLSGRTSWLWSLLAYIPLLLILGFYIAKRAKQQRMRSAASRERHTALKQLDAHAPTSPFLRSVGTFIETKIPPSSINPALEAILKQRDELAFLPEGKAPELSDSDKRTILDHVKKAISKLPLILVAAISLAGTAYANANEGEQYYQAGEFSRALEEFSRPANDAKTRAANYYGAGNCLYRLNRPGEAALAYQRALEILPLFTEAQHNLQFIQRKEGAIMPAADKGKEWLSFIPYSCLPSIILLSGAVSLTSVAWLLTRRKAVGTLSVVSAVFFLTCAAGIVNLALYPRLPSTVEPERLLIVTSAAPARHAADKDSPVLMTIPPSTPLILEAARGSWYYAKTFNGTPLWLEASHAEIVSPITSHDQP